MNPVQRRRIIALIVSFAVVGGIVALGIRGVGRLMPQFARETSGSAMDLARGAGAVDVPVDVPAAGEFQAIEIVGGWRLTVSAGDYDVAVTSAGGMPDGTRASVRDGALRLEAPMTPGSSDIRLSAVVTMPQLSRLAIAGGADVQLGGIETDRFELSVDGAASVRAAGSRFAELQVKAQGATNIDFRESRTVDAHVELDGASNLLIRMDGGSLTGTLRGVGNINWTGTASESIRVEGIGRVRKQ